MVVKLKQKNYSGIKVSQAVFSLISFVVLTAGALGFFVGAFSYYAVISAKVNMATTGSSGLVGYWSFDENQGNAVNNTAPSASTIGGQIWYIGQSQPAPYWPANTPPWTTTAVKGSALTFTGFRSYARLATNLSDVANNQISVSYWLYLNKLPTAMVDSSTNKPIAYPGVFDKYTVQALTGVRDQTSYQQYFAIWSGAANKLSIKWFDTVGGVHDGSPMSNTTFQTSKWYHITWVFNGTDSKLYVNGVLDNSSSANGLKIKPLTGSLSLSSFANSLDGGIIDEVKIYNSALTDSQITKIYQSNNCGTSDPMSVDCMTTCGDNNDATDAEKLNCVKNSCQAKYGATSPIVAACADPRRVSFNSIQAFFKITTYCKEPGTPNSEDCLIASAYKLSARDTVLKDACDYKNPGTTLLNEASLNEASNSYKCFQLAKYGTYNIINTLVNCSGLPDPNAINECTYYLGFSTPNNTVYDQRALEACKMFNNCSTVVAPVGKNYGYMTETQAKSKTISKSATGDLLSELMKKYVTGYCLNPGPVGACLGPESTYKGCSGCTGTWNVLRVGQLGFCAAICDYDLLGQACSGLFASYPPNRRLLNGYAQSLVESCANFSWPESASACKSGCLCANARAACERPNVNPPIPCDSSQATACHTCFMPDLTSGADIGTTDFGGMGKVTGTKELRKKIAIMLNALCPDSRKDCCSQPFGKDMTCKFGSSYRSGSSGDHGQGKAVDLTCSWGTGYCDGSSDLTSKVDSILSKIKGANSKSKLSTIRECTKYERGGCSDSQAIGPVIHISDGVPSGITGPCSFAGWDCKTVTQDQCGPAF